MHLDNNQKSYIINFLNERKNRNDDILDMDNRNIIKLGFAKNIFETDNEIIESIIQEIKNN